MKKILILISCLLLCSCESVKREDYYTLSFDSYSLTIGYDNVEYLDVIFDFDIKTSLDVGEQINDVELNTLNGMFGKTNIVNTSDKIIDSKEGLVNYLEFYINDYQGAYKLDDVVLDDSVSSNCSTFNGTLVNKNGTACIIQKEVNGQNDVVTLYGDILADDQDKLNRITIEVK